MWNKVKCLVVMSYLLVSCGSFSSPQSHNNTNSGKTLEQIVSNESSMTVALKELNPNLTVSVISSGYDGSNYERLVLLRLESIPVIAAISVTNKDNAVFVNLLSHASSSSIGAKLFAPGSDIRRDPNMQIKTISLGDINDLRLRKYLLANGVGWEDKIIVRLSKFYTGNEEMELTEYILPGINNFLSK